MKTEEEFLKSDFEQCFEHMRYYDSHFLTITNFIFGGIAAVIVASIAFLASKTNQSITLLGSSILFFFSWAAGTLLLAFLLRNRVYFYAVARYVNEIRGNYLKSQPIGFQNETGLPISPKHPKLFSLGSTQTIIMFFIALGNSIFLGASIGAVIALASVKAGQQIQICWSKPIIVFLISSVIEILWIIIYLRKKDSTPASIAWWGKGANHGT